jgi:Na+-driven multidrug efflux pump
MVILIRRPVVCGLVYWAVVYLIMNFVVVPLTRVPHARAAMTLASRVSGVLALLFCIGVTVAVLVRRETMLSRQ